MSPEDRHGARLMLLDCLGERRGESQSRRSAAWRNAIPEAPRY
jgi:hypothetical protein